DGARDDAVADRRHGETVGDARRELALRIARRRFLRRLLRHRRDDAAENDRSEDDQTAWHAASCRKDGDMLMQVGWVWGYPTCRTAAPFCSDRGRNTSISSSVNAPS